jgi:SAM-dependent methyltransferase
MIDHDNLEEFEAPALYDAENGAFEPEGPFYLALAKRHGGPVLDLACGTGRIAIPIAAAGIAVTGIDLSRPMLAHGRLKAGDLPVRFVEADCRTFDLGERFRVAVMSGHGFQFMLTDDDQRALLAGVHRHLAPGGIFAFETRNPKVEPFVDITEPEFWRAYAAPDGTRVETWTTETADRATGIIHYTVFRRWPDGRDVPCRVAIRFSGAAHVTRLIDEAGFDLVALHGDWDGAPASDDCRDLVFVCRRPG